MDVIERLMRAAGVPVTRENWLLFVFGEVPSDAVALEWLPRKIAALGPGEEAREFSMPSFAKGLIANMERRKAAEAAAAKAAFEKDNGVEHDWYVQRLRAKGLPVTQETWIAMAIEDGQTVDAEFLDGNMPDEIFALADGEELPKPSTRRSQRE